MDEDLKDGECPGCGSLLADRESKASKFPEEEIPTALYDCNFCNALKCCMCDMGTDTNCLLCDIPE